MLAHRTGVIGLPLRLLAREVYDRIVSLRGPSVVALLTVLGVATALLLTDVELALVALSVMPILVVATLVFRKLSSVAYAEARERVSVVNADVQAATSELLRLILGREQ